MHIRPGSPARLMWCSFTFDADPPVDAESFAFWRIPGHKQLLHDGMDWR